MDLDASTFYFNDAEYLVVLHDLRDPEAVEALHRARAVWQERSDIEALDHDHLLLIVRPGGALEIAA